MGVHGERENGVRIKEKTQRERHVAEEKTPEQKMEER